MMGAMTAPDPEQAPTFVGIVTLVAGTALTARPAQTGRLLRMGDHPSIARAIGLSDLALVPGLLAGRAKWPWMAARAALNLVIAVHYRRVAAEPGGPAGANAVAAALVGLTVIDGGAAIALRARGR